MKLSFLALLDNLQQYVARFQERPILETLSSNL